MDARTRTMLAGGAAIIIILLLFRRLKSVTEILNEASQPVFHIDGPVINTYQLPGLPDIIFPPFAGGDVINFQLPTLGGDNFDLSKLFGHPWDWMQTTDLACGCSDSAYTPAVWITVKEPTPPAQTQFIFVSQPAPLPPMVMKPATTYPKLVFGKSSSMTVG